MGDLRDQPRVCKDQGVAGVRVAGLDPLDQRADVPGAEPAVGRGREARILAPLVRGAFLPGIPEKPGSA